MLMVIPSPHHAAVWFKRGEGLCDNKCHSQLRLNKWEVKVGTHKLHHRPGVLIRSMYGWEGQNDAVERGPGQEWKDLDSNSSSFTGWLCALRWIYTVSVSPCFLTFNWGNIGQVHNPSRNAVLSQLRCFQGFDHAVEFSGSTFSFSLSEASLLYLWTL